MPSLLRLLFIGLSAGLLGMVPRLGFQGPFTFVRIRVLWMVGLISGFTCLAVDASELGLKESLLQASRVVDRIVITPTEAFRGEPTPREIVGRERVAEMLATLDFEPRPKEPEPPCLCLGTHRLEFYRGDHFKFDLTYHHWSRLRSDVGGPWLGDAVIEGAAADRLIAWFTKAGFAEFEDERKLAEQAELNRHLEWQKIQDLFRAEARAIFPPFERSELLGGELRQRGRSLADTYADKSALLIAIWESFALMSEGRRWIGLSVDEEPGPLLLEAAGSVSLDDVQRALSQDLSPRAQQGALQHFIAARPTHAIAGLGSAEKIELARTYLRRGSITHFAELIREIAQWSEPEANELLFEMVLRLDGKTGRDEVREGIWQGFGGILVLAKRSYAPLYPWITEKRRERISDVEWTVLNIAALPYEPNTPVLPEYLTCNVEGGAASELAWIQLKTRTGVVTDAAFLAAAAKSWSSRVKNEASALLARLGLAVVSSEENAKEAPPLTDAREKIRRGAYLDARQRLRSDEVEPGVEAMTAALATGRLGEAADIARIRIPRNGVTWALLGLQGVLYYSLDDFSTAGDQFSAASQIDYSYELLILRHLCLLHVGQAAHSELHRWEPYISSPDLAVDWVKDKLIRHLQGKAAESDVIATIKASRNEVRDCSLAYFVLSALARLGDDPKKERAYLDSCLSIGAYDSLPHLLALRRVEAVESEVLASKMINAKP